MAAKRKKASSKKKAGNNEPVRLHYSLGELPTSQHRAGLAGLVLHMKWIARQPHKVGSYELVEVDERGATVEIDEEGLGFAFDDLYAASTEEVAVKTKWKKKGKEIPPLRTEKREVEDDKGRKKSVTQYIYPQVVPRGSLVLDFDQGTNGSSGLWIKLWRDFTWQILRGVPAQRRPFNARANGEPTTDHVEALAALRKPETAVPLPSTYFVGAQEKTAEDVPFSDRARFQFLLRYWPVVVPIYVPQSFDVHKNESKWSGFAVAVPDISLLDSYCEELPVVLRDRPSEALAYRPRAAVVDLAAESALDFAVRLRRHLALAEGARATGDLVHAFDVLHVEKQGNNVRLLSAGRVEPDNPMIDEYAQLSGSLWDPVFRRQRLLNLLARRSWHHGFDGVLESIPAKTQGFGSRKFRHDARITFENEREAMTKDDKSSLEQTIYRMCRTYVSVRLKQKKKLAWKDVKDTDRADEYSEEREKIARDAFLAIRGRRGEDFLEYFAGTIGSVPHHLGEDQFVQFTQLLRDNPDDARTLTLLALSAVG